MTCKVYWPGLIKKMEREYVRILNMQSPSLVQFKHKLVFGHAGGNH